MAFTEGGQLVTCAEALGTCEEGPVDACGRDEVLGPPNGMTLELEPHGRIELGFRCGAILEQGETASPDFQIWATVPDGARAVVEVSFDGTTFTTIQELTQTDQRFDLAWMNITVARFVRLSGTGSTGIELDAIEAFR